MVHRIPVKYFIIIPICFLVAICNFIVAKTLTDSIADSRLEIFTEKNITNLKTIVPTLALSIWEFNVDRVASTLTGIDDGETFVFAAVLADELEFSFRGDRTAYSDSIAALSNNSGTNVGHGRYLLQDDILLLRFPIILRKNNYDVGYLLAGFHLASLKEQQQDITNQVNSIAAFATSVVLLGIIVFSWFANLWLNRVANCITGIANGQLEAHVELDSPIAEFQDIDLALQQLRVNAFQLIELRSKARSDEKIRHMAMHDALTNLANRRYLDEYKTNLAKSCQSHGTKSEWLEVLHIDLDGFKSVNDSFGHAAGDRILQIASERLQVCVAETGQIFRVGGDEFVVIRHHKNSSADKIDIAYNFASKLIESLGSPYEIKDTIDTISASVGLVINDEDEWNLDTLLFEADIAMYEAKSAGKNCFVDFTSNLREAHNKKKLLAYDLDSAIENGQIQPYYQPKVNSKNYTLCGAEALVRWKHPELGILTPDKFLTLAQERGLLVEIDRTIFKLVCFDIKQCQAAGYTMPTIAINLSSSRLTDPRLLDDLREANLEADSISFELLETVYFDEVSGEVLECLNSIREFGVKIELDDFGSGHASMIGLLNISPDRLKIDRRFVREMLVNTQSEKMISKIVEIGKGLDIPSTAEGVESEQQAKRLVELGCDVLQGYYFGMPIEYTIFFRDYVCNEKTNPIEGPFDSDRDHLHWSNAS